eukprot:scaffold52327_cov18-Tisochrysis_lutea.AAC.1
MQQSAACELPHAFGSDHPLLQPWMDGSPTAIHVPAGYHLFTYPDGLILATGLDDSYACRAYMICAESLNLAMQQRRSPQGSMVGGANTPPGQGRAPAWVMEVGVAGFEGRWCRVRTYIRNGRVQCWDLLDVTPGLRYQPGSTSPIRCKRKKAMPATGQIATCMAHSRLLKHEMFNLGDLRKEKNNCASPKRLRAIQKGSLASKLARASPKGPQS